MPGRTLMLIGLLVMAGCAPATPQSTEPETVEPTVDIPATVAAAVAKQTGATPVPTQAAAVPTATPTTAPITATPVSRSSNQTSDQLSSAPEAVPVQGAVSTTMNGSITVHPSEAAHALTGGLLMSFTHSIPEYTDWVRGTFLYIEDERFCEAGRRFRVLAKEARDDYGERLPAAAYNAGVSYMALAWNDQTDELPPYSPYSCRYLNTHSLALDLAVQQLENVLPHLTTDLQKAAANLMLGRAYANKSIKSLDRMLGPSDRDIQDAQGYSDTAAEHLCEAVNLDSEVAEAAQQILTELDRSCNR